jgi:hypothetical protein
MRLTENLDRVSLDNEPQRKLAEIQDCFHKAARSIEHLLDSLDDLQDP